MMREWIRLIESQFTDAFLLWFGQSKVITHDGQPKIVYHGTPDVRDILRHGFRPSITRGHVYFFSDSYAVANTYADDRRAFDYQAAEPFTIPVYLSLQNPMIIDGGGKHWRNTEESIEAARRGGHDGIIIYKSRDEYNNITSSGKPSTIYAVFDPKQIKSASQASLRSRVDGADLGGAIFGDDTLG